MKKLTAIAVVMSLPFAFTWAKAFAQGAHHNPAAYTGSDSRCGGLFGAAPRPIRGIVFHCQEDLAVANGDQSFIQSSRGNHSGAPDEAFCGMKRFGDTPGAGSFFQAEFDPKTNTVHYDGLAKGQGAKIFQHIASRWIVTTKSDAGAVANFVCTDDGWQSDRIGIGPLRAPAPNQNRSLCVNTTILDDGSRHYRLGNCPG